MRPALKLFVVCAALIVVFSTTALAQSTTEIRVRILHSKTHRPLKGRKVEISFYGTDGKSYSGMGQQVGRTQSDRVAVFRVKQPVPALVNIQDLNGYTCSDPELFPTRDVMQSGAVAPWTPMGKQYPDMQKADDWCTPDPNAPQHQATPGELVFFVHPLTLRERRQRASEE